MSTFKTAASTALAFSLVVTPLAAQERDRAKIGDRYKWNLTDIYPTEAAWKAGREKIAAEIPSLSQFQGTLGESPQQLAAGMDKLFALQKEFGARTSEIR